MPAGIPAGLSAGILAGIIPVRIPADAMHSPFSMRFNIFFFTKTRSKTSIYLFTHMFCLGVIRFYGKFSGASCFFEAP